jgi:hypothetical protein
LTKKLTELSDAEISDLEERLLRVESQGLLGFEENNEEIDK